MRVPLSPGRTIYQYVSTTGNNKPVAVTPPIQNTPEDYLVWHETTGRRSRILSILHLRPRPTKTCPQAFPTPTICAHLRLERMHTCSYTFLGLPVSNLALPEEMPGHERSLPYYVKHKTCDRISHVLCAPVRAEFKQPSRVFKPTLKSPLAYRF